jgi:hypothetical protein
MSLFKKTVIVALAVICLTGWSLPSFASQDSPFEETFKDAFYGGLTGALVGAAALAFTKKPGDHLDYLYYGAAGGVLVGATYGLVKSSKALAELENGKVHFAMPTIMPEILEPGVKGPATLMISTELIRGKF